MVKNVASARLGNTIAHGGQGDDFPWPVGMPIIDAIMFELTTLAMGGTLTY